MAGVVGSTPTRPTLSSLILCRFLLRLYASACSNSCQLVALHPIVISILFHHYKELKNCMFEVDRLEDRVLRRAATVKLRS